MTPLTKLRDDFKDRLEAFHKISNGVADYSANSHDQDLQTFCQGYDAATRIEREKAKVLVEAIKALVNTPFDLRFETDEEFHREETKKMVHGIRKVLKDYVG